MLERLFQLQAHGTTVRKEVVAGITTFLTMAYIIVVNPSLLSSTGMDFGAVFVATCLAAVIGTPRPASLLHAAFRTSDHDSHDGPVRRHPTVTRSSIHATTSS